MLERTNQNLEYVSIRSIYLHNKIHHFIKMRISITEMSLHRSS